MDVKAHPIPLCLVLVLASTSTGLAQEPKIAELEVQKVEQTTYFRVRFELPSALRLPRIADQGRAGSATRSELARLPRLVPQDASARLVYLGLRFTETAPGQDRPPPLAVPNVPNAVPPPAPGQAPEPVVVREGTPRVDGLEFFGQVKSSEGVGFLLLYPTEADKAKVKEAGALQGLILRQGSWAQVPVTLDFTKAKKIDFPKEGFNRKSETTPDAKDLEGNWAMAQAAAFAVFEAQAPDFGYYGFARLTTARRYKVPVWQLPRAWWDNRPDLVSRRTYDLTTGTTAIAETLALNRLRNPDFNKKEDRTIDVAKVQGIDIAEHPWLKMMAGQKPTPEPLARLVPHDNYYVHFKNIAKFLEAGDLFEQWGTGLARAFEANSREHGLKERLEQQLCLKSSGLARVFGPAVVKGLALTGSDPYVREGSDVTVIFHAANKAVLLGALQGPLEQAKKKFGGQLMTSKSRHQETDIESFVTPLREVSLHRAVFEDFIVCSNSAAGVRRVLDAYRGKLKPLSDSLDFQYMRTVFRLEDPNEDGFAFLSDPFLRNLVGPALRIKERRRLEGLTSLYMVTHGALFTAWETGKLPSHHNHLLSHTGLRQDELFSPEGAGAFWDHERQMAFSEVYNHINFATPLIELPIDKVTPTEQQEYENFRRDYMGLWRQFFDPIGMRFSLKQKEIRWETYVLPLVQTSQYNELRRLTGNGTIKLESGQISPQALVQFFAHLSPQADERKNLGDMMRMFARDIPGMNWLGNWFSVRLDDSAVYARLLEHHIRAEMTPAEVPWEEELDLLFQVPLTLGVEIRNPLVFAGVLAAAKKALNDVLPGTLEWEPVQPAYKGVNMVQIKVKPDTLPGVPARGKFNPALTYALVDGAFYLSLSETAIKETIDQAVLRREGKLKKGDIVEVNTAMKINPEAAVKARGFLDLYLEYEAHRRAQANALLLYPLFHAGLVGAQDDARAVEKTAMKFLGFVPVSPDLQPYVFERQSDEVSNRRHGSVRQPKLHAGIDPSSPAAGLLGTFRTIRADMRFREDGLHATVTLQRK